METAITSLICIHIYRTVLVHTIFVVVYNMILIVVEKKEGIYWQWLVQSATFNLKIMCFFNVFLISILYYIFSLLGYWWKMFCVYTVLLYKPM